MSKLENNDQMLSAQFDNILLEEAKKLEEYGKTIVKYLNELKTACGGNEKIMQEQEKKLQELQLEICMFIQEFEHEFVNKERVCIKMNNSKELAKNIDGILEDSEQTLQLMNKQVIMLENTLKMQEGLFDEALKEHEAFMVKCKVENETLQQNEEQCQVRLDIKIKDYSEKDLELDEKIKQGKLELKQLSKEKSELDQEIVQLEEAIRHEQQHRNMLEDETKAFLDKNNCILKEISESEYRLKVKKQEFDNYEIQRLELQKSGEEFKAEILMLDKHIDMENHPFYQTLFQEEKKFSDKCDELELKLANISNELEINESKVLEKQKGNENFMKEINHLNTNIEALEVLNINLTKEIQEYKEKDMKESIEAITENIDKLQTDISTASVNLIKLEVSNNNLERRRRQMPGPNFDDVELYNHEIDELHKTKKQKNELVENEKQRYATEVEELIAKNKSDTEEELSNLSTQFEELENEIKKLSFEATEANMDLDAKATERQVFARKLQVAKEARDKLKKDIQLAKTKRRKP